MSMVTDTGTDNGEYGRESLKTPVAIRDSRLGSILEVDGSYHREDSEGDFMRVITASSTSTESSSAWPGTKHEPELERRLEHHAGSSQVLVHKGERYVDGHGDGYAQAEVEEGRGGGVAGKKRRVDM